MIFYDGGELLGLIKTTVEDLIKLINQCTLQFQLYVKLLPMKSSEQRICWAI